MAFVGCGETEMNPYLSIVIAASNQSNGRGNFLTRMQRCVDSILSVSAYPCSSEEIELVIVEWGPPEGCLGLRDVIDWGTTQTPIRLITVPKSLVATIPNPQKIPFFEPYAKNVGIRRARGKFVLTTNADSIYTNSLIRFLMKERFRTDCFYRVDRHDIDGNGEVLRKHTVTPHSYKGLHFNGAGEFVLMSREKYHEIGGWPELEYWGNIDGMVVLMAHDSGLAQIVLPYPLLHIDHPRNDSSRSPLWDDASPYAIKNKGDWGFKNHLFNEILLGGNRD